MRNRASAAVPFCGRLTVAQAPALAVVLLAALAFGAVACGGGEDDSGPRVTLKVMTRNLYLGADLVGVIFAPGVADIPARAAEFWQTVQKSDFPERAKLIADEIAVNKPDLVALQEVEWFRTRTPSTFSLENPPPPSASDDVIDFLKILRTELGARDLRYQEVVLELSDAELPAGKDAADPDLIDLRMTDRDVILIREGINFTEGQKRSYSAHLPLRIGAMLDAAGGVPISLVRGYTAIQVNIEGADFTFVNSHLEVGGPAQNVQEAQANELVAALDQMPGTLIVAGDFNSNADGTGTASYGRLTQRGRLIDAWPKVRPMDPGPTCCSSLKGDVFSARSRIDLVLYRGPVRAEAAEIVGTDPAKRTPSGLWPSDHAGVVVTLSLPQPR
jgi:endonuclease/exonuclease/phosphatase family metal-dependent hydrolase